MGPSSKTDGNDDISLALVAFVHPVQIITTQIHLFAQNNETYTEQYFHTETATYTTHNVSMVSSLSYNKMSAGALSITVVGCL